MEIRDLAPEDVPDLVALVKAIYGEMPAALWFEREPEAAELLEMFQKKLYLLSRGEIADVVAFDGGKAAGECEIIRDSNGVGLVGIILRKDLRGKRVGRALLERATLSAKRIGIRRVRAEVSANNRGAASFFKKMGFKSLGRNAASKRPEGTEILELEIA